MWQVGETVRRIEDLERIELHDAVMTELSVDYRARTVTVLLDKRIFARIEGSDVLDYGCDLGRAPCKIVFEGVASFNQISDLVEMERNAFAGTVNQWRPQSLPAKTYIHLVNGCIEVAANGIEFGPD